MPGEKLMRCLKEEVQFLSDQNEELLKALTVIKQWADSDRISFIPGEKKLDPTSVSLMIAEVMRGSKKPTIREMKDMKKTIDKMRGILRVIYFWAECDMKPGFMPGHERALRPDHVVNLINRGIGPNEL